METSSAISFSTIVYLAFLVLILFALKVSIKIVPQSENWLVERLGKYNRNLEAGLHLTIPFFESVRYKVQIQERQLPPKPINAITQDNVTIEISLAVLYRIPDASKTMYRIADVDASKEAEDMDLPGYKFHALKGDRKGEFAVTVTGNWRITFEFIGEDAINVNLEDYH
jgi:hypothetical protein